MKQSKPLVITISRQLGSGGAYIGQQLAQKLNFYYADREIINKTALLFSISAEEMALQDEKLPSFWDYVSKGSFVAPGVYIPPNMTTVSPTTGNIFEAEKAIIEHIADKDPAVIIGRCGFHILHDHPNCLKIFLNSEREFRIQRVSELYNIPEATSVKIIEKSDRERTSYNKTFTGKEWADARNYDLSINTGKVGVDKTIDFIMDYLKHAVLH